MSLTTNQLSALQEFAKYNGRTWKASLRQAWITGIYPSITKDTASLQQVRNAYGPSWLVRFRISEAEAPPRRMNYRFSLGDSNTTGVGVCFTVEETSEENAVAKAQEVIDSWVSGLETGRSDEAEDVCVYVGPDLKVTADDIDDAQEAD